MTGRKGAPSGWNNGVEQPSVSHPHRSSLLLSASSLPACFVFGFKLNRTYIPHLDGSELFYRNPALDTCYYLEWENPEYCHITISLPPENVLPLWLRPGAIVDGPPVRTSFPRPPIEPRPSGRWDPHQSPVGTGYFPLDGAQWRLRAIQEAGTARDPDAANPSRDPRCPVEFPKSDGVRAPFGAMLGFLAYSALLPLFAIRHSCEVERRLRSCGELRTCARA